MSMKELSSKFLSLLRYAPYIIDEKQKIQRFLNCLPASFKDRIEFDNLKTLEEAMRKDEFCYEQSKKRESLPNWKTKKTSHFEEDSSQTRVSRVSLINYPITTIRKLILRTSTQTYGSIKGKGFI